MYDFNPYSLLALALSLVGSVVYVGYFQLRAATPARAFSKVAATGGLALAAALGGVSLIFAGALGFAALGDYLKSFRSDRLMNWAIVASAIMQVLVCVWFVSDLWVGVEAPFAAVIGVFGIAGGFFALIWPNMGRLGLVLAPYLISSLVLFSIGLGVAPGRPLLFVGLTLYLISLLLLGFELFLFHGVYRFLRVVGPVIWVCYYFGLMLMMLGGAD